MSKLHSVILAQPEENTQLEFWSSSNLQFNFKNGVSKYISIFTRYSLEFFFHCEVFHLKLYYISYIYVTLQIMQ